MNDIEKIEWHSLGINEIFKDINTTSRGLSAKEARETIEFLWI